MTADPWGGVADDPWATSAPPAAPPADSGWGAPAAPAAPVVVAPTHEELWGGERTPSFSFGSNREAPGIKHGGRIVALPDPIQERDFDTKEPKFWVNPNGEKIPKWLIPVHIQADYLKQDEEDDGVRAFYLKYKQLDAAKAAVRKAGAQRLEIGGHLFLEHCGYDNRTKLYRGVYAPPGAQPPAIEVTRNAAPAASGGWGAAPTAPPAQAAPPPPPVPAATQQSFDPWQGLNPAAAQELTAKGYQPQLVLPVIQPLPNWQGAPASAIIGKVGPPPRSEEPPF